MGRLQRVNPVYKALVVLPFCIASAYGSPFISYGARNEAMGGVATTLGVSGAIFNNPALLSSEALPYSAVFFGMRAMETRDPDGFEAALDDFHSAAQQLAATPTAANAQEAKNKLAELSSKSFYRHQYEAGGILIPNTGLGGGAFLNQYTFIHLAANIFEPDLSQLDSPVYNSTIRFRGYTVTEFGVAYAKKLKFDRTGRYIDLSDEEFISQRSYNEFSLGFSPKLMMVRGYDYAESIERATLQPDIASGGSASVFNFDLGFTRSWGYFWQYGLAIRNVMPVTFQFSDRTSNFEIALKPQVRTGGRFRTLDTEVAVDLDLTENSAVGEELPSQVLALGFEWRVASYFAVRVGYRANRFDSNTNVATLGVGGGLFGVRADVAVSKTTDQTGGVAEVRYEF